ncbi:MAG: FtsX-like permease family protein, partial [Clostridiales Family XIII bacterium]|nr:FtsX-like permease family protein [Clostridiales Family XIII bacterium]
MRIMRELAARQLRLNRRRTAITLVGIILSVAMITAVAGFTTSVQDMAQSMFKNINGDWHISINAATTEQADKIMGDPLVEKGFTEPSFDEETIDVIADDADNSAAAKAAGGKAKYKEKLSKLVDVKVRLAHPTREYDETAAQLAMKYGVTDADASTGIEGIAFNKELLASEGYVAGDNLNSLFKGIAGILIFVIFFGSIMVISNAFSISANERIRQFGILKSIGSTKRQISASVVSEGIILATIGIPAGILLGFAVQLGLVAISNTMLGGLNEILAALTDAASGTPIHFRFVISLPAILVSAAVSFITILISAWLPARRAAKITAIEAIRMSKEIKIKAKKLRTPKLISKLFGFEGALAQKYLKRSSRAYRATVASLVVGIILYLVASGFGTAMTKSISTTSLPTDLDANVIATARMEQGKMADGGWEKSAELMSDMQSAASGTDTERIDTLNKISLPSEAAGNMLSDDMGRKDLEYLKNDLTGKSGFEATVTLVLLDEQMSKDYSGRAGVSEPADGEAILVNAMEAFTDEGTVDIAPFRYEKGSSVEFSVGGDTTRKLTLGGELKDVSGTLRYALQGHLMCMLVNENTYKDILAASASSASEQHLPMIQWFAKSGKPDALSTAWNNVAQEGKADDLIVDNSTQDIAIARSIVTLMMIFIYSFIAMLSLIGVTSVIGAISTNIRLRAREFAMLSSVGMTPQTRRRMLNLESLFYGAKALIIGIPIGVFISWAIYHLMARQFGFGSFQPPWVGILVSIGAVFLLTFATMRYASNRLKGMNIVETLHDV